tara:strand:- start:22 stop:381 length:360 start_codon:yes stop_codon:yes gene_type:complete
LGLIHNFPTGYKRHFYISRAISSKMLAPIAGSRNRLMRLYERLGFIPIGDNVVVLVTLKAYSTYLSNIDDLMPAKPHMEKHSPYGQKERMEMMGMWRGQGNRDRERGAFEGCIVSNSSF